MCYVSPHSLFEFMSPANFEFFLSFHVHTRRKKKKPESASLGHRVVFLAVFILLSTEEKIIS